MFVEDVGRHNAIDTIAGWMWLHGVGGGDKTFYTTGRLTSEMVMKSAQMGVPIIVSRNGVTRWATSSRTRLGHDAVRPRRQPAFHLLHAASSASTPSPSRSGRRCAWWPAIVMASTTSTEQSGCCAPAAGLQGV